MSLKIRKGTLWRTEIENRPGTFAEALEPFANAGQNLQIVMGYTSGSEAKKHGAVEIFPVTDDMSRECAKKAGLHEMTNSTCLIVEGEDKPGVAYKIAKAIADADVNLHFAMCQSVGSRYQACFGFGTDSDATKAEQAIEKI